MGKERLSDCKLVAAARKQADHHAGRMFLCAGEILACSWFQGWRRSIRPLGVETPRSSHLVQPESHTGKQQGRAQGQGHK